ASDYLSKARLTSELLVSIVRQSLRVARMESALRQTEEQARLAVESRATRHLGLLSACRQTRTFGPLPHVVGHHHGRRVDLRAFLAGGASRRSTSDARHRFARAR